MGVIIWAGVPSTSVGVVVERYPAQPGPSRRIDTIQVPGRNGDLVIDQGAWDNYGQDYEVYFRAGAGRTPEAARIVRAWLMRPQGYQRLEDSYDPDFYRMAYYQGPADIENAANLFGRMTITYTCKPQRWRKDGEQTITLTAPKTLYNDLFTALPKIRVYGSGAGTFYIGDQWAEISDIDGYVDIDSELQDAYKDTVNKNATLTLKDQTFPALEAGENSIRWDGGITRMEIIPRWWTI